MSKARYLSICVTAVSFAAIAAYWLALRKCKANDYAPVHDQQRRRPRILSPNEVHAAVRARELCKNSIVARHALASCHALVKNHRSSHKQAPPPPVALPRGTAARCYGCGKITTQLHSLYVFSCIACGSLFHRMRALQSNLGNQTALVVGGRTKLGHQVALKFLHAGAVVIVTTRFPMQARAIFAQYDDYKTFRSRLFFAPSLDLRRPQIDGQLLLLQDRLAHLVEFVRKTCKNGALDILVNCAAQTIACRERKSATARAASEHKNRYGDALHVASDEQNSWAMRFEDVGEQELRDVHDVNAIGIALLVRAMLPVLRKSKRAPFIVNVHAREGLFQTHKSAKHFHTNMAKAALHMLTRMLCEQRLQTDNGKHFCVHGVDPGWFSVDEYYENDAPMPCAPLDEIDAAARVCYPIFKQLPGDGRTRRHFTKFAV